MATKPLKVAIVHDWFVGGGAEKVVLAISQMFPGAPIYTSYCSEEWRQKLAPAPVITSYMQPWPFSALRKFLPVLREHWFSHLDLRGYDLVISSSGNGEAKGVRVPAGTPHVCYCHWPTHFYWRHYNQYLAKPGFGFFDPLARLGLKILVGPLRRWDLKAAKRPDYYLANSTHIQSDIKKYYHRDSTVLHPPVDTERFVEAAKNKDRFGFVTVGRQTAYKKTDIIVTACSKLNLPLTVIGRGPEHDHLESIAGPTIKFVTGADDQEVANQMAGAAAFIFAAQDDFGITPVEAMAAGTPVIAYQAGGARDYVKPGVSGEFFEKQTVESLEHVLRKFSAEKFKPEVVSQYAQEFSIANFKKHLGEFLTSTMNPK